MQVKKFEAELAEEERKIGELRGPNPFKDERNTQKRRSSK